MNATNDLNQKNKVKIRIIFDKSDKDNQWHVLIDNKIYSKCHVKSLAVEIMQTARRDYKNHGKAAFPDIFELNLPDL